MKKKIKVFSMALMVAAAMSLGSAATAEAAKGSVKSVTITKPTKKNTYVVTLKKQQVKKQLKVNVKTSGKISKAVKYKSSKKSVVSIDSKGMMTFKKAGKATITVTSTKNKKKKDTLKITVKQAPTSVTASVKKPVAKTQGIYTLQVGKTYSITKKVGPSKAYSKAVTYKSSKSKIAKVTSKGKITAKKAGTATITVTSKANKAAKATFKVVVAKKISKKVTSVTATAASTTLLTGTTTNVATTVAPANATLKTIIFGSNNEAVATVDANGKVTAKKAGTATITAYAIDGSKKKAAVKITVKDAATSVAFTAESVKAYVGETATVEAKTNADAFDTTVTYSIDAASQKFATVDSKTGVVTAKARGIVTVTATTVNGKTATAKVTIVDKTVTKVTPVEGKTAEATVTFNGDLDKIEADILSLLKDSGLAAGATKQVKVNGKAYEAKYTGTSVSFDGKKLTDVVGNTKTVAVTVGGNAVKFVNGLQMAQFKTATYTYEIKIGNHTFTSLEVATPYAALQADGKTYSVYAENGSIYFVGDVKADLTDLVKDGAATLEVVNN